VILMTFDKQSSGSNRSCNHRINATCSVGNI